MSDPSSSSKDRREAQVKHTTTYLDCFPVVSARVNIMDPSRVPGVSRVSRCLGRAGQFTQPLHILPYRPRQPAQHLRLLYSPQHSSVVTSHSRHSIAVSTRQWYYLKAAEPSASAPPSSS